MQLNVTTVLDNITQFEN